MSISSIVQIASRLLNGDTGQDSQGQRRGRITPAASQAQSNRTEFGDRVTPSTQGEAGNATGGAGLFQVEQLRFTAMNIQTVGGNAPAGTATTAAVPPTPAVAAASPIQAQQDLQALNRSLTALGLNADEFAAFDQFAGVLLQFDPKARQDLQNQLNLLVTRFRTQNAAPAVATQTPAASLNFQLTELSILFSGLNGTLTQGNPGNSNGTSTQFSAFTLQIQEVRVAGSNPTGETTQLTRWAVKPRTLGRGSKAL